MNRIITSNRSHPFKHKRGNPEAHLVLQIIKYCKARGYFCGKVKVKGSFSKQGYFIKDPYLIKGLPDILCFTDDKVYFIEAKVGNNTQTPEQQAFQLLCKSAGIPYILAYDLETVQKIIK